MDVFLPLSAFLMIIVSVIKAMTPIVTTTIKENQKTQRTRISLGAMATKKPSAIKENNDISSIALVAKGRKSDAAFGLASMFISSAQLGWLQFGVLSSAPLTVGRAWWAHAELTNASTIAAGDNLTPRR